MEMILTNQNKNATKIFEEKTFEGCLEVTERPGDPEPRGVQGRPCTTLGKAQALHHIR
jgi:hypothetical protein